VTLGRWGGRGSGRGSAGWVGLDWFLRVGSGLAQMFSPENRWASSKDFFSKIALKQIKFKSGSIFKIYKNSIL
jgi:hypothetical protein